MEMTPEVRLRKLIKLEEQIRQALLGEDPEARYDLVSLREKVQKEINVMVKEKEEAKRQKRAQ